MRHLFLFLGAIGLLTLGGCDTGTHQRLNCICLIDYSGSLPEQTLRRYVEVISSEVYSRLGERDRLVVIPIDEGAKTEAVKLVYDDRVEHKFTFYTDGYAHAHDSLLLRLREYAQAKGPEIASILLRQKTLREKYTYLSDIFAALEQAAALEEQNDPDTFWAGIKRFVTGAKRIESTNVLLIFSDMIQESRECSFAAPDSCPPSKVGIILEKLQAENRIPDLHGWKVFVNGRTGKDNEQVENIQNFWAQYFKDAGASLLAYDYDCGPQITSYLMKRVSASN